VVGAADGGGGQWLASLAAGTVGGTGHLRQTRRVRRGAGGGGGRRRKRPAVGSVGEQRLDKGQAVDQKHDCCCVFCEV